ncbi:myelin protein zero-like protein 3 [Dipodomys merriami]|uniref:myelin protein zero-like protein 3 n=1 Tax=Dipodomys merriami TaxID=94247 RepID=UPI003855A8B1
MTKNTLFTIPNGSSLCAREREMRRIKYGKSKKHQTRISAAADIRGYVGENVKLRCTFKSSSYVTDKLTIDCKYRPPSSSCTKSIFHYQSFHYPTTAGTFLDQISWDGNAYKGDASISISNPNLMDNRTFSCAVKNLPDVHHDIPLTELTITERGFGTMLSSVALLSILVFIPSAVVIVLLLVRILKKAAGMKKRRAIRRSLEVPGR